MLQLVEALLILSFECSAFEPACSAFELVCRGALSGRPVIAVAAASIGSDRDCVERGASGKTPLQNYACILSSKFHNGVRDEELS